MPLSPDVNRNWEESGLDVFDELPVEALEDWCRDGLVVVHPVTGRIHAVTRTLLVDEDSLYAVEGGARTTRAFFAALLHECVAICKKMKPDRQGAVCEGWTSVFSSALVKPEALSTQTVPEFWRCYGRTEVRLEKEWHEKAKESARRQRPPASFFTKASSDQNGSERATSRTHSPKGAELSERVRCS
jgi:hypothetical protein